MPGYPQQGPREMYIMQQSQQQVCDFLLLFFSSSLYNRATLYRADSRSSVLCNVAFLKRDGARDLYILMFSSKTIKP